MEAVNYAKPFMVRDDSGFADDSRRMWDNGYTSCHSSDYAEELSGRDNIGKRKWDDAVFNHEIFFSHKFYAFYNKVISYRGNGVLSARCFLACIS